MTTASGRVPSAPGSQGFAPQPATTSSPVGADPSRETYLDDEFDYDEREGEWCDRCQGSGIANCYCGGDQCYCENYGEMECPICDGEGYFVPTEASKAVRADSARMWRELHESLRDRDRSGEAGETPQSGSTEGKSQGRDQRHRPNSTATPPQDKDA